jgi:hypothetical protein
MTFLGMVINIIRGKEIPLAHADRRGYEVDLGEGATLIVRPGDHFFPIAFAQGSDNHVFLDRDGVLLLMEELQQFIDDDPHGQRSQ